MSELLIANEEYLKSGIHIGTKFKTKYMSNFIYKTRGDGLSVLNVQQIDARIRNMISMMSNYAPKEIMIVARRENGWKAVKLMGELLGMKVYTGRYPPGILTNIQLKKFMEIKLIVVTDPWPDRNAVEDALRMGIPVIAMCDTNNQANNIDLVVPCNNKGKKSLGILFWLVAKGYMENRGLVQPGGFNYKIEDFAADD